LSALQTAAEELGFDSEGLSEEELTIAVESVLEKLAKELAEQSAASEEVLEILSEYLGVENISNLSVEEVKAILEEKSTAAAAEIETVIEEEKRMKALLLKTEKNMCLLQMLLQYLDA
jgi:uncharacterized protein YwgA